MKLELTAKGILYLTNSSRKFKSIVRDRPFYNQYNYCIAVNIPEVDLVNRSASHGEINQWASNRRLWRARHYPLSNRFGTEITETVVENLHEFLDWVTAARTHYDFKLVTTGHTARIYSNDLDFLDSASSLPYVTHSEYSKCEINRPRDTIRLKTVNHRYRSYFKSVKLTDMQKTSLISLLNNAQDLRLSPSLKRWVEYGAYRSYDYLFIDHNDLGWLTMISLIRSGFIRKTIEIIPDK